MSMTLKTLSMIAALAVLAPLSAAAQSTETEETTNDLADQLPLGEDASKNPDLNQPYIAETIGAWEMRCVRTEEEEDPCQMYQLLDDGQGAPVAEVSLFRLPDGGQARAGGTIVVPLETSLTDQMTISIDGGQGRRYPFAFCNPVGCYARMGLTEADVNAYKRGNEAIITIVPALAPDQEVKLTLSLEGFTASYDKVSVIAR